LRNTELSEPERAFAAVALGSICDKRRLPWNSKFAADLTWWDTPPTLFDPTGSKGLVDLF